MKKEKCRKIILSSRHIGVLSVFIVTVSSQLLNSTTPPRNDYVFDVYVEASDRK